jgi:subtilisin family serine protease
LRVNGRELQGNLIAVAILHDTCRLLQYALINTPQLLSTSYACVSVVQAAVVVQQLSMLLLLRLMLMLMLRRDVASHGTHVAATAAGNYGVRFRDGILSGMAPRARIAAYKVC